MKVIVTAIYIIEIVINIDWSRPDITDSMHAVKELRVKNRNHHSTLFTFKFILQKKTYFILHIYFPKTI